MTKHENIFNLYDQLNKSGARGDACRFIAKELGIKASTVKGHWLVNREIPDYVTDEKLDTIIEYLQNAVRLQNEAIKNIEVA